MLTPGHLDFAALRAETMQKNEQLQKSAEPVLKVIENPEVVDRLKGAVDKQRNMELLQKEYNVSRQRLSLVMKESANDIPLSS